MERTPVRKRRWFRYSLRTLLVLITVACVWLGVQANRVRLQRAAVAAVGKKGFVLYDFQMTSPRKQIPGAVIAGPDWLRQIVGDDYFRSVVEITGDGMDDDDLALFAAVSTLQEIWTDANERVTDEGLAHLSGLTRLEYLTLYECPQVTDGGLKSLKGLDHLKELRISGASRVTDAGLEHLSRLTSLSKLILSGAQVSDPGIKKLQEELPSSSISTETPPLRGK